jgi:hypothetical protein
MDADALGHRQDLERMAAMDANSTYIRLEDNLATSSSTSCVSTRRQIVARIWLDFGPRNPVSGPHRQGASLVLNQAISRLGPTPRRKDARLLAARGWRLCLVTARDSGPMGYIEAGRAMERIWLAANARGLAVQPHGVLPQYLTKVEVEPETFVPRHADTIRSQREPFYALFPGARDERPAIVLRVGFPTRSPVRRSVRIPPEQVVRR